MHNDTVVSMKQSFRRSGSVRSHITVVSVAQYWRYRLHPTRLTCFRAGRNPIRIKVQTNNNAVFKLVEYTVTNESKPPQRSESPFPHYFLARTVTLRIGLKLRISRHSPVPTALGGAFRLAYVWRSNRHHSPPLDRATRSSAW